MTVSFYEQPILNSPYEEPRRHHALDDKGRPTEGAPKMGRRRSELATPMVPASKKQRAKAKEGQVSLDFRPDDEISSAVQEYDPTPIINEIRSRVADWRRLPSPADWGVTPATTRLLQHWRHYDFQAIRPFFCQLEAVETIIWLTEVARSQKTQRRYWDHIRSANAGANPELVRIAMKMATGAGKTTVMAMLMAWQTVNAVRSPTSKLFTRGFLIVTPGITIRDRLRVLQPNDPDSYYKTRDLVPADMLGDINKAKIVIIGASGGPGGVARAHSHLRSRALHHSQHRAHCRPRAHDPWCDRRKSQSCDRGRAARDRGRAGTTVAKGPTGPPPTARCSIVDARARGGPGPGPDLVRSPRRREARHLQEHRAKSPERRVPEAGPKIADRAVEPGSPRGAIPLAG